MYHIPIATFVNDAEGTAAHVFEAASGFNVRLQDLDTGLHLPTSHLAPTLGAALKRAAFLAHVEPPKGDAFGVVIRGAIRAASEDDPSAWERIASLMSEHGVRKCPICVLRMHGTIPECVPVQDAFLAASQVSR